MATAFEDERIDLYATWYESSAHTGDIAQTVAAFRQAFPETPLSWPDIGKAALCSQSVRRDVLRTLLRIRESMAQEKAIEHATRLVQAERIAQARKELLRQSRETLRSTQEAMDQALGRLLVTLLEDSASWQEIARQNAAYALKIKELIGSGLRPSSIGSVGRWTGEGPDAVDAMATRGIRQAKAVLDTGDLLVREGGMYTTITAGDLRRDHAGKLAASDPILIGRVLRYRGGDRLNESKGIFAEEGWRRTLSEVITGRRDGINTRSRTQMRAILIPWTTHIMRKRVRAAVERTCGHLHGNLDAITERACAAVHAYSSSVFALPHDLIGNPKAATKVA